MMNKKRKWLATLLALVLMFSNMPCQLVQAEESLSGLVVKDQIEWNGDDPYVNEGINYQKECGASPNEEKLLYLRYIDDNGNDMPVDIGNLTVTCEGEEPEYELAVRDELLMIKLAACGEYTITYTADGVTENNTITIWVGYPDIGYYTSASKTTETYIANAQFLHTNQSSEAEKTFYLISSRDDATVTLDSENPMTVSVYDERIDGTVDITNPEEVAEYISYEQIQQDSESGDMIYKITVRTDRWFGLNALANVDVGDGVTQSSMYIDVQYKEVGFVFADAQWDDSGNLTGDIYPDSYGKERGSEIETVYWTWLGTTSDGAEYTAIDKSLFENKSISVNNSTEYTIVSSVEESFEAAGTSVIVDEELATNGIYGFYVTDDISLTYQGETIYIRKELPLLGFYKGQDATFENYVTGSYQMSETEMYDGMDLYVLPREDVASYSYSIKSPDNSILINGGAFDAQFEGSGGVGFYKSIENYQQSVKITVSECANSYVELEGVAILGADEYGCGQFVEFHYQSPDGETLSYLEDGKPHLGFAGCFITKNDYNLNSWSSSNRNYYWVHADTIQGVIDELVRVAEAGSVTLNGQSYAIEATDYIWLNVSYFAYSKAFAETDQYVVTPNHIKGIIMQAGKEAPYAKHESGYYIVSSWEKDGNVLELCQIEQGGVYYPVSKLDGNAAVTNTADYLVAEGATWTQESLESAGYELQVNANGEPVNVYPVYFPNLYVDATVEVKINGNFTENAVKSVQLGFYEGSSNRSLVNGRVFSAADIGTTTTIGEGSDKVNVSVKAFNASATCSQAPIDGSDCEVSLDGENESLREKINIYQKGDDDYADAKELAKGEPLKVTLDVQTADADGTEAKKVAEKIEEQRKKDKTKGSKIQYLDICMSYQVGERTPKGITETVADVDITMDIPESFCQMEAENATGRVYKVYRYHNGKVDILEAVYDAEHRKLKFKTNGFSTYALVAEDVVPITESGSSGGSYGGGSSGGGAATKDETTMENYTTQTTVTEQTDGTTVEVVNILNKKKELQMTVTIEKDKHGKPLSAKAVMSSVAEDGKKAVIPSDLISKMTEITGDTKTLLVVKVKDEKNKLKYTLKVDPKNLETGNKLYLYKWNKNTGQYVAVNKKAYVVGAEDTLSISIKNKATYKLVDKTGATKLDKKILATIKPAKTKLTLAQNEKKAFTLKEGADEMSIKKIVYKTSNSSIATVSKKGTISAKKAGTVQIKAKIVLKNGKTKTITMKITVK